VVVRRSLSCLDRQECDHERDNCLSVRLNVARLDAVELRFLGHVMSDRADDLSVATTLFEVDALQVLIRDSRGRLAVLVAAGTTVGHRHGQRTAGVGPVRLKWIGIRRIRGLRRSEWVRAALGRRDVDVECDAGPSCGAVQLVVSADSADADRLARQAARPIRVADIAHRLDGESTRHVDFNRTELLALSRRGVSCDGQMQGCGARRDHCRRDRHTEVPGALAGTRGKARRAYTARTRRGVAATITRGSRDRQPETDRYCDARTQRHLYTVVRHEKAPNVVENSRRPIHAALIVRCRATFVTTNRDTSKGLSRSWVETVLAGARVTAPAFLPEPGGRRRYLGQDGTSV